MLRVEFREESADSKFPGMSYLGRKHIIEFDPINSLEDLESAFFAIAQAVGFSYVAKVNAVKLSSLKTEDEDE